MKCSHLKQKCINRKLKSDICLCSSRNENCQKYRECLGTPMQVKTVTTKIETKPKSISFKLGRFQEVKLDEDGILIYLKDTLVDISLVLSMTYEDKILMDEMYVYKGVNRVIL